VVVADVERIIRLVEVVALVNFITTHPIQSLQEHILSLWVPQGSVAWGAAPLAGPQRMAVILFLDPSTVMAEGVEDPLEVWIMEGRGARVVVLHVLRPVVRRSKLPPDLEMLEEILQEV
jgi:hypothetical protein